VPKTKKRGYKLKKTFWILVVALLLSVSNGFCFSLWQNRVELKKGKVGEIIATNVYPDKVTVKVSVSDEKKEWYEGKSCKESLKVFPKYFELEPKQMQVIRVISRKAGRCRLYFLIDRGKVREIKPSEKEKFAIGMKTLLKIGIPVIVKERGSL